MEGGTYVLKDINRGMWIHLDLEFLKFEEMFMETIWKYEQQLDI